MARDFSTEIKVTSSRPNGISDTRAPASDSKLPRAEIPFVTVPAAPTVHEKRWEQWFWSLLEMSWGDIWQGLRNWEVQLRPESPRLASAWFIAWSVTGLSGILLLLSLLTEPAPRVVRGREKTGESQVAARVTAPVPPSDDLEPEEPTD